jgi:hypothetical protein
MEVSATFFKSIYDNKTHKNMSFSGFPQFEEFLYKLSERKLEDKKAAQLISPATYIKDTTRANKNVVDWAGWAAMDVDDHEFKGDLKDDLIHIYGKYYFVCYSTASSRESLPKFRLVFPLTERVRGDNIRHFWYALNTELQAIGDAQTKDLSRMYYIPGSYSGAFNFIFTNTGGSYINPRELMASHSYQEKKTGTFLDRLPTEMQKSIIEFKNIAYVDNTGRYAMVYKIMVSIASSAIKKEYPINTFEIVELIKQLDADTAKRYENRPLNVEADRAIEYAYRNI